LEKSHEHYHHTIMIISGIDVYVLKLTLMAKLCALINFVFVLDAISHIGSLYMGSQGTKLAIRTS